MRWFRDVAPYVHDFRGKTFVVAFGGELVRDGVLNALIQDLSLLSALGVKLILVHGSRPQVNEQLRLKGYDMQFGRGTEPTSAPALECAKEAAGEIRLDIEAAFSQGLQHADVARQDSCHFGQLRHGTSRWRDRRNRLPTYRAVRKIDVEAMKAVINQRRDRAAVTPGIRPRARPSISPWKTWPPVSPSPCVPRSSSS